MEMFPCQSSMILAYGYDGRRMEMDLVFNDGSVFRYHRVPEEIIVGFVRAASKGKYFLECIKHQFDYAPRFSTAQTDAADPDC